MTFRIIKISVKYLKIVFFPSKFRQNRLKTHVFLEEIMISSLLTIGPGYLLPFLSSSCSTLHVSRATIGFYFQHCLHLSAKVAKESNPSRLLVRHFSSLVRLSGSIFNIVYTTYLTYTTYTVSTSILSCISISDHFKTHFTECQVSRSKIGCKGGVEAINIATRANNCFFKIGKMIILINF